MNRTYLLVTCALLTTVGCTSFKSRSLYRLDNDSVVEQQTNAKLRGIPVKLKIPSHVGVTIYEQQVLLARSTDDISTSKEAATQARGALTAAEGELSTLKKELEDSDQTIASLKQLANDAGMDLRQAPMGMTAEKRAALNKALQNLRNGIERKEKLPGLISKKSVDVEKKRAAANDADKVAATPKYNLVAFDPQQFVVESDLIYTDKVFMVDFKRPLAGVLNLTEATIDNEHYFANVQAEVEERTIQDINTALANIGNAIVPNANLAVPTSADTPAEEANKEVNFQKSVVAYQRFDISEAGWECRVNDFVNRYIKSDNQVVDYIPAAAELPSPTLYK